MSPRLLYRPRRRPSVEIVRHPDGPIEIQLSGLVDALERRARRWCSSCSSASSWEPR